MKKYIYLLLFAFAPVFFVSCGDDENETSEDPDEKDVVVVVNADGNAKNGHRFTRIDESNFYIDEIKYTALDGNLYVSGYDKVFFKGKANIISTLKYNGQTLNVISIGEKAFMNCNIVTSVNIPNGIKSIGDYSFYRCTALTSASIGKSVTMIGRYAFYGCTNLSSIIIPQSVNNIGYLAFWGCKGLEKFSYCELPAKFVFNYVNSISQLYSSCESMGEWCAICVVDNKLFFKKANGSQSEANLLAVDGYTGFHMGIAGFIVGLPKTPEQGETKSSVACFDLACSNCYDNAYISRALTLQEGGLAYCSRCHRTYELNYNGQVCQGETGKPLYRYRVNYDKNILYIDNL